MTAQISIDELSKKPAFSLTAGEMAEIIVNKLNISHLKEPIRSTPERKKIKGIQGLANYISCSPTTAQKLKSSGKIPFYNIGSKVYFFSDEIDFAMSRNKEYKETSR